MNVLASLIVLGLLIFFHEAGHFLAATLQGIKVSGFSIGFGPSILKKQFKGVTYSLRALPLGGFVSFPEEEKDTNNANEDPDLLGNRPIPQRALVISAGVLTNLFLAWLILLGQGAFIGIPENVDSGVLVMSVLPNEAAAESGLLAGDKILKIDGEDIGIGQDAVLNLVRKVQTSPGKKIEIESVRGDQNKIIEIIPSKNGGSGKIGAQLQPNISSSLRSANGLGEVLNNANNQFNTLLKQTINGYKGLITNFTSSANQLSGPVKIVEIGAQLSEEGAQGLLLFAVLISINLAVLNALPLPLLDGGQLMILVIEGIQGKPIPQKIQMAFMQSGFLLLVGLSLVLIVKDTSQLSLVQELIHH